MTLISNGVSTYGIVSTTTTELFQDEAQRLYHTGLTAFVSSAVLPAEEAKVIPGALTYNAPGAATQYFDRRFSKAVANNGSVQFGGIASSATIAPYGTGNLNVLIKLETENLWFDLGRPFGSDNGTGDGSSPANSKGARASFSSGVFGYSFGTYSTANNGNQFLMEIIMKTGAPNITNIITS